MQETKIHPLAYVEDGAILGHGVQVEPFAVVKKNVTLKDHVTVHSHAYIDGYTTIGEYSEIWPSASIGTKTQDKKYQGERTYVYIGKRCEVREFVTINSSSGKDTVVSVGDHCLIMAYCHIAHNCTLGDNVVMSNNAMLAGHVDVGDYAIIGGMTGIHQFTRIGNHAMVGGMSRVTRDVLPYSIGTGNPYSVTGVNRIGLKRRGFSFETRIALMQAFRLVYSPLPLEEALVQIKNTVPVCQEIKNLLEFCETTQRGLSGVAEQTKEKLAQLQV